MAAARAHTCAALAAHRAALPLGFLAVFSHKVPLSSRAPDALPLGGSGKGYRDVTSLQLYWYRVGYGEITGIPHQPGSR